MQRFGRAGEIRWPPPPPPPTLPYCLLWEESFLLSSPICPQRFMARCWARRLELDEKCPPSEVHEGVKLQTPLCPRPCASKGISSFIDRAGWMSAGRPATSSSSPDCFCFQVTSYLLLQLFQFLRACCMKTESFGISRSLGNVHKPQLKDNPREKKNKKSLNVSSFHARWASQILPPPLPLPPMRLHQMNNQRNVRVH